MNLTKEMAEALSQFQASMTHAVKGNLNPHFRSAYADLPSVIDQNRELLAQHGLFVTQVFMDDDKQRPGVVIKTILGHISGGYLESVLYMPATKNDAQGVGSAITYGRRYMYQAILGFAADVDDDGNEASTSPSGPSQATSKGKNKSCTSSQRALIRQYAEELNVDIDGALGKLGLEKLEQLDQESAATWIKRFEEMSAQLKQQQNNTTNTAE